VSFARRERSYFEALDDNNPYFIEVPDSASHRDLGLDRIGIHARATFGSLMPVLIADLGNVPALEDTLAGGIFLKERRIHSEHHITPGIANLDFGLHDKLIIVDHACVAGFIDAICKQGHTTKHSAPVELGCFTTT